MKEVSNAELADLMLQLGATTIEEAKERLQLIKKEKQLLRRADIPLPNVPAFGPPKLRSPAALRAQKYYEKKRIREGKPYIPASIRALGRERAEELGYDQWTFETLPKSAERLKEGTDWTKDLSQVEKDNLLKLRMKQGLRKHLRLPLRPTADGLFLHKQKGKGTT